MCPKRGGGGSSNGVSERVVNQLLTEMDGLESRRNVFVIAATNRPDIIDPAMLRPGRLDKLLYVPLPSPEDRASILRTCARKTPIDPSIDLGAIGLNDALTGFSGADLNALIREASMCALKRTNFGRGADGPALQLSLSKTLKAQCPASRLPFPKRTNASTTHATEAPSLPIDAAKRQ